MRLRVGIVRWVAGSATAVTVAAAAAGGVQLPSGTRHTSQPATLSIFPMVRVPTLRAAALPFGGYTPAQIRAAYFLNPLLRKGIDGRGQSIVIVDSFGSPTIGHDLKVFDRQFRLRPPRSLMIIHPAGPIPAFRPTQTRIGWAEETTLDVEWAHVMAPRARIVLVETPVSENEGRSGFPQIVKAEKYVMAHKLGGVISQSFGATEETFPKGTLRPLRGAYLEAAQPAHNVTVVSASGDAGATDYHNGMTTFYTRPVTSWPASDPLVTAVGGLNLRLDKLGRRKAPDKVWNDPGYPSASGGGKSVIFGRPVFQQDDAAIVGAHRGVPDISMSASCSHPVDIYQSFSAGGWEIICGTSEATPLFAGVIALADQVAGRSLGPINADLYKMASTSKSGIVDVTRGNNTVTFQQNGTTYTVRGWVAVPGYDLSSGLGTINASVFVPSLAAIARK
ncbi:MAG TPA: S53 family peptidase [Streptosporangiaceae bacterium]